MNKSFFRKVGFGLGVDESIPSDPLEWSISQIEKLPKLNWSGPIYSLKEMMEFHGKYNYQDRRVLRKKFKNCDFHFGKPRFSRNRGYRNEQNSNKNR